MRNSRVTLALMLTSASLAVGGLATIVAPAEAAKPRCTIVGTKKDDFLRGTPGRDVICGLGGRDRVLGLRGKDILRGGAGADEIEDGKGSDVVHGGRGDDRLLSVDGNLGGSRGDRIRGGPGDDFIFVAWKDVGFGGPGNDDLRGLHLRGGRGIDYCFIPSLNRHGGLHCENDGQPPMFSEVALSAGSLDVRDGLKTLVITARLREDLGTTGPSGLLSLADPDGGDDGFYFGTQWARTRLVSGDHRDGRWRMEIAVDDWAPTGAYDLTLTAFGRDGGDPPLPGLWRRIVHVTGNG